MIIIIIIILIIINICIYIYKIEREKRERKREREIREIIDIYLRLKGIQFYYCYYDVLKFVVKFIFHL